MRERLANGMLVTRGDSCTGVSSGSGRARPSALGTCTERWRRAKRDRTLARGWLTDGEHGHTARGAQRIASQPHADQRAAGANRSDRELQVADAASRQETEHVCSDQAITKLWPCGAGSGWRAQFTRPAAAAAAS